MEIKVKLGDKVKDKVTGFIGIVTSISSYLNGCVQCTIVPKVKKDGSYPDGIEIDHQSLEIIPSRKPKVKKDNNGGPVRMMKRMRGY